MNIEAQVNQWMDEQPVIRQSINREIIEITGEDRRPIFQEAAERMAKILPLIEAEKARKIWLTVSDFWTEFSNEEKYAIEVSQDPTLIVLRADLKLWLKDVWSDDPRIQFAMGKLVELGILSEERKTQIIAKTS